MSITATAFLEVRMAKTSNVIFLFYKFIYQLPSGKCGAQSCQLQELPVCARLEANATVNTYSAVATAQVSHPPCQSHCVCNSNCDVVTPPLEESSSFLERWPQPRAHFLSSEHVLTSRSCESLHPHQVTENGHTELNAPLLAYTCMHF